jgi:hypothetical protein
MNQPIKNGNEALHGVTYRRMAAVEYANAYWNGHNSYYVKFDDDCTNFISQCLHAGGIPMVHVSNPNRGWWYKRGPGGRPSWSYSWTVANTFYHLLKAGGPTKRCQQVASASELRLGDVICYDWDGDGRYNHSTIVTAFTPDREPLVNAHTINSRYRHYLYRDSTSYTPRIRYAFFQID